MLGDGGATAETHESGGFSGGSSEVGGSNSIIPSATGMDEISERSGGGGGNRWPRQETIALLKIRSDMDVVFRDSSLKGPLWEEVSRKMTELGFQRSAKKCKEKFENVFKYHKRTKDGRQTKPDGKSYRFFDQLEALENTPTPSISFAQPPPHQHSSAPPSTTPPPPNSIHQMPINVSSPNPLSVALPNTAGATQNSNNAIFQPTLNLNPPVPSINTSNPPPPQNLSNSTSSSTSSDEDIHMRRGKKRKWKNFFERLMKDVIHKQEELQKKFLDTLEKRERDQMAREEAWRVQEMTRMNREHEILVKERSVAATKDAAVIAFLQKVTSEHNLQVPIGNNTNASPASQVPVQAEPPAPNPQQTPQKPAPPPQKVFDIVASKTNNVGKHSPNPGAASSSRWPKVEIEALIRLRTDLELKYQDNSPKGPLWEEISLTMAKLGYNRNSKRCKEKWENINKYFKKVKESSKKRPEDSKTCPYFHQLDAIYRERAKNDVVMAFTPPGYSNPMLPIVAEPEQQWPLPQQPQPLVHDSIMQDQDGENDSDDNEEYDDDDDEEDEGGRYEIVTNKQPSAMEMCTSGGAERSQSSGEKN